MENKIIFEVLTINPMLKKINSFMQAVDVFEKSKKIVTHQIMTLTGTPDMSKIVNNIRLSYEKAGGEVIFIGLIESTIDPENHNMVYFDPGTRILVFSKANTLKSCLFADFLKHEGYIVETNEYLYPTMVKYPQIITSYAKE